MTFASPKTTRSSYSKNDPSSIQALFDDISTHYERGNAILSCNAHRLWNNQLIHTVVAPKQPMTYLDLCCGTGDISLSYLSRYRSHDPFGCHTHLLDFSKNMLSCAKKKAAQLGLHRHEISYLEADAQEIPLPDRSVECITVAYGIRNIHDPAKCFAEISRTLKPGGVLGILELTRPSNPLLKLGHSLYLRTCLPLIGKMITSNREAYHYLCQSIHHFVSPQELAATLQDIGFLAVRIKPLFCGIATLITAKKS